MNSLIPNDRQESSAWAYCDLTFMNEGGIKECGSAWVYKRTEQDKASINQFVHLLADPNSLESTQLDSAKNQWRSQNKDYFLFYPWAPHKGCGVTLKKAGDYPNFFSHYPEYNAIMNQPSFYENCENRTWDMSGRLYRRDNHPKEYNLSVPKSRWISGKQVYVLIYDTRL